MALIDVRDLSCVGGALQGIGIQHDEIGALSLSDRAKRLQTE